MRFLINKKLMILAIFIVSLLAVSAVSAADNATEDIAGVEKTADEVVSVNENQTILNAKDVGTFTELQKMIDNAPDGSTVTLKKDYQYDEGFSEGSIYIDADKKLTIDGKGHTIDAKSKSRIFSIYGTEEITLKNINFINGFLKGSDQKGCAIRANYLNLFNCNFENNIIDTEGSLYSNEGGVVYVYNDLNMKNCVFKNNSAGTTTVNTYEVPSHNHKVYNLNIDNCLFVGNKCDYTIEATDIYKVTVNNSRFIDSDSCAIDAYRFNAYNSHFENNNGALSLSSWGLGDVYVEVINCKFIGNTALHSGAAISASHMFYTDQIYLTVKNCQFINNVAGSLEQYSYVGRKFSGGAIYLYSNSELEVNNCSFINNFAYGNGGAINTYADSDIKNSEFINNGAVKGGAVYGSDIKPNLNNCVFEGNSAQEGTAIYSGNAIRCKFIGDQSSDSNVVFDGKKVNCEFTAKPTIVAKDITLTAKYDSASRNIVATVKDANGNAVSGLKVGFAVDGVKYVTTDAKGQAKYSTKGLAEKKYSVNVMAYGNDLYKDSNKVTVTFDLSKIKTALTTNNVVTTYNSGKKLVATLKDANGKAISGAKVKIKLGTTTKTLNTDKNGQVSLTTDGLIPDTYVATISFEGNDVYDKSSTTAKVTINKLDTKLTARYDANSKNIVATVKDSNGNPVKGLRVGFALNGVKYVTTDANGQAKYSTSKLENKTYTATIKSSGNEYYKDSNKETVTFTIGSKEMSKIFLRNALYFVTQTKLVQVTLWDGNNQPLAGKTVYIRAYDSVWQGVTDENGDAFVRVGIGFGTHDATVSFDGDDQYFGSEKAGYIRVIKQTPSVMVRGADTMFKATNPVKIVKVHLRDRYDQPLPEGSKIVLKLNGKTYIGFTDAEGVARIAISINTVGTFTAQAMYGGNTAYNPVTKDVKIRIV